MIRVKNYNLRKGRKRLKKLKEGYYSNTIELSHIKQSIQSWKAHLNHGDTWMLQQKIFDALIL